MIAASPAAHKRIGAEAPHQNEDEHGERHRNQRNAKLAGQADDMVDQRRQQRREDAGDDAAGGDHQKIVAGGVSGSDRLGQRALLFATRLTPSTAATEIEGNGRGASRATNKSRANPKVDAAMAVLLPGGPTPNRLRREAHFVQCNVIVCI